MVVMCLLVLYLGGCALVVPCLFVVYLCMKPLSCSLAESKPAETSSHHVPLSVVELIHTERWGDGDATKFLRAAVENDQTEDRAVPVAAPEIGSPVGVPQWHERGLSSVRDGTLSTYTIIALCLTEHSVGLTLAHCLTRSLTLEQWGEQSRAEQRAMESRAEPTH